MTRRRQAAGESRNMGDTPATVHKAVRAHLLEGKVIEILELPGAP